MQLEETSPEGILKLKFKTDLGLGARANIGMIVLSSDQTLELEFRTLLDFEGVASVSYTHLTLPTTPYV